MLKKPLPTTLDCWLWESVGGRLIVTWKHLFKTRGAQIPPFPPSHSHPLRCHWPNKVMSIFGHVDRSLLTLLCTSYSFMCVGFGGLTWSCCLHSLVKWEYPADSRMGQLGINDWLLNVASRWLSKKKQPKPVTFSSSSESSLSQRLEIHQTFKQANFDPKSSSDQETHPYYLQFQKHESISPLE